MNTSNSTISLEVEVPDNTSVRDTASLIVNEPSASQIRRLPATASFLFALAFAHPVQTVGLSQDHDFESSIFLSGPLTAKSHPFYEWKMLGHANLKALKEGYFSGEGKAARVAGALRTLAQSGPVFNLERDDWKWIAQDAELEEL